MIAEVVSVGTELLIGEIVNGNAAVIASRLTERGLDAHYQVTVGDNIDRIVTTLRAAVARADVVVVTGGIGPTQDDVTKEALCRLAGVGMVRDAEHASRIHAHVMAKRGVVLENVLRMADVPAGSEALPNGNGLALGAALHHSGALIFSLPGVPSEMSLMLEEQVLPRVRELTGTSTLQSVVVRTRGLGESEVADRLDSLFASANPSIAFRVTDTEVHVRITAKAASAAQVATMMGEMKAQVCVLLGPAVVAPD